MVEPLFEFLSRRGIKVRWLARQTGISESVLSRAKRGERRIPSYARARIAEVLGIPEACLFFARRATVDEAQSSIDARDSRQPHEHDVHTASDPRDVA